MQASNILVSYYRGGVFVLVPDLGLLVRLFTDMMFASRAAGYEMKLKAVVLRIVLTTDRVKFIL